MAIRRSTYRGEALTVTVENLVRRFGAFTALEGVDLAARPGEFLALLGPSGSGKTTLLRIIAGLDFPDAGHVQFDGVDMSDRPARERGIGFVFQHYALFRHMTVADNIAFGLSVKRRRDRPSQRQIAARVEDLLALVQLPGLGKRYPAQLSGGQRQRVALARALAVDPRVLLLDEPFGALDAKVRQDLRRWLREVHDSSHVTSIFVTHDQEEALDLADRVVVMNAGRIEQVDTPDAVYNRPATAFVCGFIGNANRFEARLSGGAVEVRGRQPAQRRPRRRRRSGPGVRPPARIRARRTGSGPASDAAPPRSHRCPRRAGVRRTGRATDRGDAGGAPAGPRAG